MVTGGSQDFSATVTNDPATRGVSWSLPIQRWSCISEPGVRHLGPFAEDFHRAFALGTDERSLGLLDLAGVNLAATQALEERTRTLQAQLRRQIGIWPSCKYR